MNAAKAASELPSNGFEWIESESKSEIPNTIEPRNAIITPTQTVERNLNL